jgi:hypothetical protein
VSGFVEKTREMQMLLFITWTQTSFSDNHHLSRAVQSFFLPRKCNSVSKTFLKIVGAKKNIET